MKKLAAWLRFFRVINLIMIALLFWIFEYLIFQPLLANFGLGLSLSYQHFDLLVIDVLLVTVSGFIINDWYDQSIDKVNRPNRLLVAFPLKVSQFFTLYALLSVIGLAITIYLGFKEDKVGWIVLYPLFVGAFWWYAAKGKKGGLIGNVLVSLSIGALPWVLLIAEWDAFSNLIKIESEAFKQLLSHLILYSALVATTNFMREIIKDAEDAHGDKNAHVRSLYLQKGLRAMKITVVASVLLVLFFQVFVLIYTEWITSWFVGVSFIAIMEMLFIAFKFLKMKQKEDFSVLSYHLKVLLFLGLIQIAFLQPN